MTNKALPNGVELSFYPNGQLRRQTIYADGKQVGTSRLFRPDGSLAEESVELGGKINRRTFFPNGKICSEISLDFHQLKYRAEYDEKGIKKVLIKNSD